MLQQGAGVSGGGSGGIAGCGEVVGGEAEEAVRLASVAMTRATNVLVGLST